MKQTDQLKEYFQTVEREITPLVASKVLRVERLASRICDLKNEGYVFVKTMRKDFAGKRYACYRLVASPLRAIV